MNLNSIHLPIIILNSKQIGWTQINLNQRNRLQFNSIAALLGSPGALGGSSGLSGALMVLFGAVWRSPKNKSLGLSWGSPGALWCSPALSWGALGSPVLFGLSWSSWGSQGLSWNSLVVSSIFPRVKYQIVAAAASSFFQIFSVFLIFFDQIFFDFYFLGSFSIFRHTTLCPEDNKSKKNC